MAAETVKNGRPDGAVSSFEDLIAWQKARELVRELYRASSVPVFAKDYDLVRQIRRAGVSVMSNIAEGFERGNRAEFHQFLSTAKASCAEVRSQLYVAVDVGYLDRVVFDGLMQRTLEVTRVLAGLRSAVARQRDEQRGGK